MGSGGEHVPHVYELKSVDRLGSQWSLHVRINFKSHNLLLLLLLQ